MLTVEYPQCAGAIVAPGHLLMPTQKVRCGYQIGVNYQYERDATHLAEPFPETVHPSISDLLDENQLFGKDVSIQLCSSSFCLITTEVREI